MAKTYQVQMYQPSCSGWVTVQTTTSKKEAEAAAAQGNATSVFKYRVR
ncbi:hypothetical protein [Microbispora sp. KK1-11]|nr:hypothetical protein [Microbispora sp. KK1-11]